MTWLSWLLLILLIIGIVLFATVWYVAWKLVEFIIELGKIFYLRY